MLHPPAFFVNTFIISLSFEDTYLAYHEFIFRHQRFDRQTFMQRHPQTFLALHLLAKDHATNLEKILPDLTAEQRISFRE